MKTKLIVNSALSVLVALGVVACSSGGGSASADLKKSVDKVQQDVRKTADKGKEKANKQRENAQGNLKKAEENANNLLEKAKDKKQPNETAPATTANNNAQPAVTVPAETIKEKKQPNEAAPAATANNNVQPAVTVPAETTKQEKQPNEFAPVETDQDEPKQSEPTGNKVESQILDEQPGVYVSLTALNNETLDVAKLEALTKENINYSSAGQLRIASDDGKYGTSSDAVLFLASEDYQMLMTAANPNANGWKYQTFAQVTDYSTNEDGALGFINIGEKSKAADIPTAGTATYQGKLTGRSLLQHNGLKKGTVQSDVTVDVDFSTKAVSFKTQNTKLSNADKSELDLTGSATLDSTKNAFVDGKVYLTQTPEHKGELKGALFGPQAEEVGGTFNLEGGQFIGGFGAKETKK